MVFLLIIANLIVFPVFFTDNAEATVTRIGNQAGYASATGWNSQHMVRTTDGTLHVAYIDGSRDIDYANSTDDGDTWETVNITDIDDYQYRPCIVGDDSDNIYIIWGRDHVGQARDQIRYVIHWYANDTWSQVRNLTDVNFVHESPDAEVDEFGIIHLVYMKYDSDSLYCEVMYQNFTQGSGWGSVTQISAGGGTQSQELQNIAIDSNNDIHVVWQHWDGSAYNISYIKYTNSTNSWGSIDEIVTEEWSQSYATMAIDSNNNIHLAWYGKYVGSETFPQTRYYYYNATSANWENMQNWTNVAGSQGISGISVDRSDNAYVSWRGMIDGDYRVRHRNNTGGSWGSIVTIINDGNYLSGFSSVFPKVDEISINIPHSGYAFIFTNDSIPYVYFSDDFAFEAPSNVEPTQSGESPTNGNTGISPTPALYVICTDADDGDTMNATWRSNSSGAWVDFATNTSISTGTNITQTNSNFSAYNTTYYWSVNLTDGNGGWDNETYHFTTTILPIQSGESPTNGSTGVNITPSLYVICTDADSDVMTATWRSNSSDNWVDFATNTSISTGTNITQDNSNFSDYSTTYYWSVNLTDGNEGWDNETYHFTTRNNNTPTFSGEAPTNQSIGIILQPTVYVIASDVDADTMTCDFYTSPDDSAWTHTQTNSDVASGTNISYSYTEAHTSNTTYYWKVTANDGIAENVTSDIYEFKTLVNWSNIAPVLSNEIPTNGSTGISRLPQLNITVTDVNGNNSNVYWYTNASGSWYLIQTNASVLNTTVRLMSFTNASNFSTKYWWRISANDTHDNTTEIYHFTTNVPPTLSGESPTNGSTGVNITPSLYVICTDADSDVMTATWRSNSSDNWVDFATNTSISTGTNITQDNSNFSDYSTTYYWSINLSDGTDWTNGTYYFTVKENVPPVLSDETPLHTSTDIEITLSQLAVNITDEDTFNWTIGGENITTNSSNDDTSGAKNASVVGPLTYYTEYTWWVNATDGDEYTNESYTFTTEYLPADVVYVDDDYTDATEGWHTSRYDSIADALTVINETGTIHIYEGIYTGNLEATKTVTLVGMTGAYYAGRDSIIIDGDATGNVIAVSANYVNISGLTIKDGDYGIYLNGADHARIIGNIIKDNTDTGIMFENSDNALIKENNFSSSGVWIVDLDSDDIEVYHNNFLDSLPLEEGGGTGNTWNLSYRYGVNYYDDY